MHAFLILSQHLWSKCFDFIRQGSYTRGVHFAMSAAWPFVNYVAIDKTVVSATTSERSRTSRSWPNPPAVPTWLHVTISCSPSSKKCWLGRNVPAFRTSQKQEIQSSVHRLHPTIKMPLNLGEDDWNCVCKAEKSTLNECERCRLIGPLYFLFH